MAQDMTQAEVRAFLMKGTFTGKLATTRADGRPHVAPIWFVLDEDGDSDTIKLMFNTWHTTVKAKNIRREPRVALTVDDQEPPFSFVIVEGTAEIIDVTDEEKIRWATAIGGRYMGADQAAAFGKRNAVPGELMVRLTVTKVISKKDMAG
jgi:hypothetical protein